MSKKCGFIRAILSGYCPRCRKGKVFIHKVYSIMHYSEVQNLCPCCGVKFETEPGFYWGAMYFSYALNVSISILTGFILFFFFGDPEFWIYIAVIIPLIFVLTPPMVRFSRLLMMYVAAPYRKYQDGY